MTGVTNWADFAPYFTKAEFQCSHTGQCDMKQEFMDRLILVRKDYGKAMVITSGYRHPTHPVEARKTHSNGEHTQGACADIACTNGADRMLIIRLALAHGISRIGVAKNFIHLGIGGHGLPNNVIWSY